MESLFELKQVIKSQASLIKETKFLLKEKARTGKEYYKEQYCLLDYKREFRHNLIAYCELRGLKREQIEKPAKDNQPNDLIISMIKQKYTVVKEVANV